MGYVPPPPPPRYGVSAELATASLKAQMTGTRRDAEEVQIIRAKEGYVAGWLTLEEVEERLDAILAGDVVALTPPRGLPPEPERPIPTATRSY